MFDNRRFVGDPPPNRRRTTRRPSGPTSCTDVRRSAGAVTEPDIFGTLRDRIVTGALSPGERLRTRALAEELGVDPTTVRGAVNRLAAIGLVAHAPQQGARVVDLSPARLAELFDARIALEPATARLGADAIDARGLAALRRTLDAQFASDAQQDVLLAMQLDMAFLRQLYRAGGNPTLVELIEEVWRRAMPFALFHASTADGAGAVMRLDGHTLLTACEAHDGAEAERLRTASLTQARARLTALLRHRD